MTVDMWGALILAVPALVLAWAALWRRQRAVFWFAAAMIVVGTGYLYATGAAGDVGRRFGPVSAITPQSAPAR